MTEKSNLLFMNLLLFCSFGVFAQSEAKTNTEVYSWLAFGDLRGHLEPCGCDPESDLGGIARLSSLVSRERMNYPKLELYSLGNIVELGDTPEVKLKNTYLLQAIQRMNPLVYLLNVSELKNYTKLIGPGLKPRFLLSNRTTKISYAENAVTTKDSLILGYVYDLEMDEQVVRLNAQMIDDWSKIIKRSGKTRAILLFSGPQEDLVQIAQASIFTEIISSNSRPLSSGFDLLEKNDPKKLDRLDTPLKIRMVPHGGQGVLRGGALRLQKAKSLVEIFASPGCSATPTNALVKTECQENTSVLTDPELVTWLDKSYTSGVSAEVESILTQFRKEQEKFFKVKSKEKLADLKATPFAGAAACKNCHLSEYSTWETSSHAKAFRTLQDQKQENNSECVGCHVLGYSVKGGFASLKDSPHFANVQCENCHGAALDHVKNPAEVKPITQLSGEETCKQCHVGLHSPNFVYSEYWKVIAHGRAHSPK